MPDRTNPNGHRCINTLRHFVDFAHPLQRPRAVWVSEYVNMAYLQPVSCHTHYVGRLNAYTDIFWFNRDTHFAITGIPRGGNFFADAAYTQPRLTIDTGPVARLTYVVIPTRVIVRTSATDTHRFVRGHHAQLHLGYRPQRWRIELAIFSLAAAD